MRFHPVELVELSVKSYKNLAAVRVDCAQLGCLYGMNAVGKTNLLEAVGLAFGSDATLWQLARRSDDPVPDSLSCLVRSNLLELPMSFDDGPDPESCDALRGFWGMLGVDQVDVLGWTSIIRTAIRDDRLATLLTGVTERPLVRYTLQSIEGLDEARKIDRAEYADDEDWEYESPVRFARQYDRALVLPYDPPDWLVQVSGSLPEAFAPLRRWLEESPLLRSPYPDLIQLPGSNWAPIQAVWMATERSSKEIRFDIEISVKRALPSAADLLREFDRVLTLEEEEERPGRWFDAKFWLVAETCHVANRVVKPLGVGLDIWPEDDTTAGIGIDTSDGHVMASLYDPTIERLSAGQRCWVDIGLAQGSAHVERLGRMCDSLATGLGRIREDELLHLAVDFEGLGLEVLHEDHWHPYDMDKAVEVVRRVIADKSFKLIPAEAGGGKVEMFLGFLPELTPALQAPLTVLMYDEPERHLHPSAQRSVYDALSEPSDSAVLIATHSHLFMGRPGWRSYHLQRTPEGSIVTDFVLSDLELSHALVREMGLDRGELLSRITYVLIVEGPSDRAVLENLYGELLREAGIMILPLHGIDEAKSLVELQLIDRVLDVGLGLLADHVRIESVDQGSSGSKEERALRDLRKARRRRGREIDLFGLELEDILEYLSDESIRSLVPGFQGWAAIRQQRRSGEKIKDAASRLSDGRIFGRKLADDASRRMRESQLPAAGDLPIRVTEIVAAAGRHTTDPT